MIDRDSRLKLREAVLSLFNGEMTIDEFNDLYWDSFEPSNDVAVRTLSHRYNEAYFNDMHSYRLTGRHAVSDEAREAGHRTYLFLGTDLEYVYPETQHAGCDYILVSLILLASFCTAIACMFLTLISIGVGDAKTSAIFGISAAILVALLFACRWSLEKMDRQRDSEFFRPGDKHAWPFLSMEAYTRVADKLNWPVVHSMTENSGQSDRQDTHA